MLLKYVGYFRIDKIFIKIAFHPRYLSVHSIFIAYFKNSIFLKIQYPLSDRKTRHFVYNHATLIIDVSEQNKITCLENLKVENWK